MARRRNGYVPLDNDIFSDPKILSVGISDRYLFVWGLTMAKRNRADGLIYSAQLKLSGVRKPLEAASRLTEARLWTAQDEHFRVTRWLKWNMSEADLEQFRDQRADAGRAGGIASGQVRNGQPKQDASEDEASCFDASKQPSATNEPTPPQVTSPESNSSSSSSIHALTDEDDERIEQAFQLIADKRIAASPTRVNNPRPYRAKVIEGVRGEYRGRAQSVVAEDPTISALRLAHNLEPESEPESENAWMTRRFPTCARCHESIVPPDAQENAFDGAIHADCHDRPSQAIPPTDEPKRVGDVLADMGGQS